jgi:hypothetical protein
MCRPPNAASHHCHEKNGAFESVAGVLSKLAYVGEVTVTKENPAIQPAGERRNDDRVCYAASELVDLSAERSASKGTR